MLSLLSQIPIKLSSAKPGYLYLNKEIER
uniref:Uncharacterized protein n=1 Tax=Rhizophora mucronata TaxID=61149 RepID=A0A2P2PY99_RHIMU